MKKKKYIEASELPDGEKVYLKKIFDSWSVIHPIRDEDGSINKMNLFFGGKANLIRLTVLIVLVLLLWYGITELVGQYADIANNPCAYCTDEERMWGNQFDVPTLDLGGDNG